MKGKRKLPEGWNWVSINNILDHTIKNPIRMGPFGSQLLKGELVADGILVLGIEHVLNKCFNDTGVKFITDEKFDQLKGFEAKPGEVLITMMGTIGRTAVVPDGIRKSIIGSHLLKMKLRKDIFPEYIAWVLSYLSPVYKQMHLGSQGAIMQGLNTGIVKKLSFPLPPTYDDQVAIVNELERKIADIEKIRQAAHRQREAIATVREAILREAFPYKEGDKLPERWKWAKLGDLTRLKNGINFDTSQVGSGILTLDVFNMFSDNVYPLLDDLYRVNVNLNGEYVLQKGDILFVRSSVKKEGVGWPTVFQGFNEPVTFCGFLIRARLIQASIFAPYLVHYFRKSSVRNNFISASGQSTITNINQNNLRKVLIPLPATFDDQLAIVKELECKMADVEKTRQGANKQFEAVEALPGAILREVFDFEKE